CSRLRERRHLRRRLRWRSRRSELSAEARFFEDLRIRKFSRRSQPVHVRVQRHRCAAERRRPQRKRLLHALRFFGEVRSGHHDAYAGPYERRQRFYGPNDGVPSALYQKERDDLRTTRWDGPSEISLFYLWAWILLFLWRPRSGRLYAPGRRPADGPAPAQK